MLITGREGFVSSSFFRSIDSVIAAAMIIGEFKKRPPVDIAMLIK